ncbi:hypothetical protein [Kocuria sp. U4B]
MLATTLGLLAAALLLVGGLTHYLRLVDLDESVRQDIVQAAGELQRLAQRGPLGPDASPSEDLDATAEEPFTDVAQLFCTFMTTTVPGSTRASSCSSTGSRPSSTRTGPDSSSTPRPPSPRSPSAPARAGRSSSTTSRTGARCAWG